MTPADLPPLPDVEQEIYERCRRFIDLDAQEAIGDIMQAYAKLAVRQALERAKEAMYEQGAKDRAACAAIVRAMIEEYK